MKKKTGHRIEFTYDPMNDETICILWEGMQILESDTVKGKLSDERKTEIETKLEKEVANGQN